MELLGIVILALAVPLHLSCVWLFLVRGRGTPLPFAPPSQFVVRGPYRFSRNPMALAFVSGAAGLSLLLSAPLGLLFSAAFGAVLHLYVTRREEPELVRRFDGPYVDYCQRVPRWIPRLRSR